MGRKRAIKTNLAVKKIGTKWNLFLQKYSFSSTLKSESKEVKELENAP